MRDNALYFPYISLPNDQWTVKTLLYWDKLSSIVPMDHIEQPEQFSPFMQQLVQEGLVEQVFPSQHLYQIADFEEYFVKLVDHRVRSWQRRPSSYSRIHSEKITGTSLIHAEKMAGITDYLIETGLASRTNNWAWFEVDKRVANLFMAYLAACLGAVDDVNAAPVTNKLHFAKIMGNSGFSRIPEKSVHHLKARDVILKALLPTPNEKVSVNQLLRFKSDHGHLLPLLRRKIEAHCAAIAILPNSEDRIATTEQFVDECQDGVNEIIHAMKPTWKKVTLGSLSPVIGAGFTLHAMNTNDGLAYAGAAFTFAATAYQAIASIRRNRIKQINKPLAYVAHARTGLYA